MRQISSILIVNCIYNAPYIDRLESNRLLNIFNIFPVSSAPIFHNYLARYACLKLTILVCLSTQRHIETWKHFILILFVRMNKKVTLTLKTLFGQTLHALNIATI